MPPQYHSDSETDEDVIYSNKVMKTQQVVEDDEPSAVEEEEEGEDDGKSVASDEFTVEQIMDHRFERNELYFHVKWQDYPSKKDWTWEPEENLMGGSDEILQEYYRSIGGRPVPKTKKRGRPSTASFMTPAKSTKKSRISIAASTISESPLAETKEGKWKPPSGNWEDQITHIDTIEKTDNGLIAYVQWGNGRKSQHDINVVYKKCPQRMLSFYEQHLVFKETGVL
ncbi:hypothetical protein FN846DRAFT_940463 [Sphaerosporella brunnea]|uniref:Chromo domain-containing protein n=1 Tax=Sphaerosporella brunnea TaxID=1250544 RepID=A0A5J5F229_9PEZI|nr:hypothetical protein FN846DRAFT_940463 [Sphaerosporella brunnea]